MTHQAHSRQWVGSIITTTASLNVVFHIVALALAAAYIQPGSPLIPLPDRLHYLSGPHIGWTLAWSVWVGSAALMVAFTGMVAGRIGCHVSRWAVVVAIAALAIDLYCDRLFMAFLPAEAARAEPSAESFLHAERLIGFVSLTFANGLYSISTLLMSLAFRGRPGVLLAGIGVCVSGMLLAAAGITGVPEQAYWATPPTIGLYCVWVILVARSLRHGRDES